jgi:tungstate transport system permease protein
VPSRDCGVTGRSVIELILSGDANLFAIVRLSLFVTLSATLLAAALGLPLGAFAALARFPGRNAMTVLLNAAMGLPPVVVGLLVYLLLSRSTNRDEVNFSTAVGGKNR